jgi:hypothetical protein
MSASSRFNDLFYSAPTYISAAPSPSLSPHVPPILGMAKKPTKSLWHGGVRVSWLLACCRGRLRARRRRCHQRSQEHDKHGRVMGLEVEWVGDWGAQAQAASAMASEQDQTATTIVHCWPSWWTGLTSFISHCICSNLHSLLDWLNLFTSFTIIASADLFFSAD